MLLECPFWSYCQIAPPILVILPPNAPFPSPFGCVKTKLIVKSLSDVSASSITSARSIWKIASPPELATSDCAIGGSFIGITSRVTVARFDTSPSKSETVKVI